MISRNRALSALGLLIALAGAPASARAAFTLTPEQMKVVPFRQTSFTDTLSFNKFDTSLGTLNAVNIQFTGLLHGEFLDVYAGTGPQDITDLGHADVTLTGPGGLVMTTPLDINTGPVTLTSGSISMSKDTNSVRNDSLRTASALAAFSGPGTVDMIVTGSKFLTGYSVTNGNGTATILLADGAYVSLRYEYTAANPAPGGGSGGGAIPEPAGLVLLATGGALLMAGRGRRGSRTVRRPEASGIGSSV